MPGEAMTAAGADTVRCFVAVPLPAVVQNEIAAAARELARELPEASVKWAKKPENLHVTLKFLGPVAEARLGALSSALEEALAHVPCFEFSVRGFGAFPSASRANVLFAGTRQEPRGDGLADLAGIVETVAADFGYAREERAFTGHVTIGRAGGERAGGGSAGGRSGRSGRSGRRSKEGIDVRAALAPWAARPFGAVIVDEVHVYESQLGGEGSTYVLRRRAALRAN